MVLDLIHKEEWYIFYFLTILIRQNVALNTSNKTHSSLKSRISFLWGQSWNIGTKCVRFPLEKLNYLIFSFLRPGVEAKRGVEYRQSTPPNLAKNGTMVSLSCPLLYAGCGVSVKKNILDTRSSYFNSICEKVKLKYYSNMTNVNNFRCWVTGT